MAEGLFSSSPRCRSRSRVRRSRPRSTARLRMRSTASPSSRSHCAACLRLRAAYSTLIALFSKSALKRLRASAQGTGPFGCAQGARTVPTLPSASRSLGTRHTTAPHRRFARS